MSKEAEIRRGDAAKALLESETFKLAIVAIDEAITAEWRLATSADLREQCWARQSALENIKNTLTFWTQLADAHRRQQSGI